MFPFFSYVSFLLLFLLLLPSVPEARTIRAIAPEVATVTRVDVDNYTWSGFQRFLDVQKGSKVDGMSKLKEYLHRFGYLQLNDTNFTDIFDTHFESALTRYQSKLGLPVSGKLDSSTVSQIMVPRCGVSDTPSKLHVRKNYAFFPGQPRWTGLTPMTLTYALSPTDSLSYLDRTDIRNVLQRAFSHWATVIPLSFTESKAYRMADIKVGFYNGDHGDGEPFDGVLGVLGHAFSPQSGRFHLDAAETWAIDLGSEKSRDAVDLESVMTHEIGHVLGLAHSSVQEAVMYPSLSPRTKKVNLRYDDVKGVQALYGSNPNFKMNSLLVSETSNQGFVLSPISNKWVTAILLILCLFRYY
ncbi:hypothetical protein AQUCO_03500166v1 [Aquilegia coerulea]|uniref:Peptidase metallopeptidase domain-containing protein n=1 Tax=Aquilegia coerulea TaxID=218851 RepID=A0A2G5CWK6_AQUCA|nr:hypothetical protein AQUCO_03500166v1 [Aquilegia coerulea]